MTVFDYLHHKYVEKLASRIVYRIIKIWYYKYRPREKKYNILCLREENMKNDKIVEISKYLPSGRVIKYTLFECRDGRESEVFSVSAELAGDRQGGCEIAKDICRDRMSAERFVYLIAAESVEPCHLKDIIYDMLPIYFS